MANAVGDGEGCFQRAAAGTGVDDDGCVVETGGDKGLVLGGELVFFLPLHCLPPEAAGTRDREAALTSDEGQLAGDEIGGEVALLGEEPHSALGLEADAAGGDGGDAAVGEADAGVGDILVGAGNGGTERIDILDGTVDDGEHQVEVVDHEVEDDGYIGAARLEGSDAGGLDVERAADAGGDRAVLGGEAEKMADLQDALVALGEAGELVGLVQRGGIWLFDKHVTVGVEGLDGELGVMLGGSGDDERVGMLDEGREVEHGNMAGFTSHFGGTLLIGVVDAGQDGARVLGQLERVEPAEMTGADQADAQGISDNGLP